MTRKCQAFEYGSSGEGSRGGRVIGHTKSGKAIYASKGDTHDWSKQDHSDAADTYERVSHDAAFSSAMLSGYAMRRGGDSDKDKAMQDLDRVGSDAKALARSHRTQAALMSGKESNKQCAEHGPSALALGMGAHIGLPKEGGPGSGRHKGGGHASKVAKAKSRIARGMPKAGDEELASGGDKSGPHKPGDKVQVNAPGHPNHGATGKVLHVDSKGNTTVHTGGGSEITMPRGNLKKKESNKESQSSPLSLMSKALAKHGKAKAEADSGSSNTQVLRGQKK